MLRIILVLVVESCMRCHALPQDEIFHRGTIMRAGATTPSSTPPTTPPTSPTTPSTILSTASTDSMATATPIPKRYPAIGGFPVHKLGSLAAPEYQWHAGIYRKTSTPYGQICGATIVKQDVVISAAHCFWTDDIGTQGAALFAVAAGKLLRAWDAVEDAYAQHSDVAAIHIPVRYRGQTTSFQDDIAVVRLSTPFEYGPGVQPACVGFDSELERTVLQPTKLGTVTGWGLTEENGGPARHLNYVFLPYIDTEECYSRVETDFIKYLTSDKICGGLWDAGISLCHGDSGGGYIFEFYDSKVPGAITAPYLLGIASVAQRVEGKECNQYTPASFTQVSFHSKFLKQHVPGLEEECRSVYTMKQEGGSDQAKINSKNATGPITPAPSQASPSRSTSLVQPPAGPAGPAPPGLQWHAAIYFKTPTEFRYTCAGSVVKTDVVISAAHCFYNEKFKSIKVPFAIAAGKLLKPYSAPEDKYAQYSDMKAVLFPKTYKGAKTYYQDDIAVVQLTVPFRYTAGLKPVCVSFDAALAQPDRWTDSTGKPASTYQRITGWALSDHSYGGSQPTLESRVAPMSEKKYCQDSYGPAYSKFLTSDKICAGFSTSALAFCRGDSGTGLTHYSYINNSTLAPYLFAVASTLQGLENKCNVPELSPASFTDIRAHEEFLKQQVPGLEEECRNVYLRQEQDEPIVESEEAGRIEPSTVAKENSIVQNAISKVITPAPQVKPEPPKPEAVQATDSSQATPVQVSVSNATVKITVTSVHTVTFELPKHLVN